MMTKMRIDKATEIAYISLDKVHLTPCVDSSGRVFFEGDEKSVTQALAKLQTNPKVSILDFINRLQTVKSIIFTMKNNARKC